MEFEKAIPTTDAKKIVYACQFTKDKFEFASTPGFGDVYFLRIGEQTHVIFPGRWLIWFPDTREYDFMDDCEFRGHYNLYDELPPRIKAWADTQPSYDEWVEKCNQSCA